MRRLARAAAIVLVGAALAGCGGGRIDGTPGQAVKPLQSPAPPDQILDLRTQSEDVKKLVSTLSDLYVSEIAIYSLRRDDVVQATLQISRFNSKARPGKPAFRRAMVAQIGGSEGTPTMLGKETVFITQGTQKQVAVWFRGRTVFILTTRDDYDMPRALLREALRVGSEPLT